LTTSRPVSNVRCRCSRARRRYARSGAEHPERRRRLRDQRGHRSSLLLSSSARDPAIKPVTFFHRTSSNVQISAAMALLPGGPQRLKEHFSTRLKRGSKLPAAGLKGLRFARQFSVSGVADPASAAGMRTLLGTGTTQLPAPPGSIPSRRERSGKMMLIGAVLAGRWLLGHRAGEGSREAS